MLEEARTLFPRLIISYIEDSEEDFQKMTNAFAKVLSPKDGDTGKYLFINKLFEVTRENKLDVVSSSRKLSYLTERTMGLKHTYGFFINSFLLDDLRKEENKIPELRKNLEALINDSSVTNLFKIKYYEELVQLLTQDTKNIVKNLPKIKEYCKIIETLYPVEVD